MLFDTPDYRSWRERVGVAGTSTSGATTVGACCSPPGTDESSVSRAGAAFWAWRGRALHAGRRHAYTLGPSADGGRR